MPQNSQYAHTEEIITLAHGVFGYHPQFRTLHSLGRIYRGHFQATKEAATYTRAVHLQGGTLPVTVRYSHGGGSPDAPPNGTVGMATKFYLPDGRVTDLVMLNQPSFVARTADELIDLVNAAKPDPATNQPDARTLQAFLEAHPGCAAALAIRKKTPAPKSFAETVFHGVHAFCFVNAKDERRFAKYHFLPDAGATGQPIEELLRAPSNHLFTELEERLARGPVTFTLTLELAEPGDRTDDATHLWPEGRARVAIGTLTLVAATTEAEIGDAVMLHDPTRVTDGIELSDDPIIQTRRGAYEVSAAQRSGGWRAHASPKLSEG
jgi:catalase